jgi:signal transduction histidine kinase
MTLPSGDLRLVIQSALALAAVLPLLFLWFRRRERKPGRVLLIFYCILSAIWGLGAALSAHGAGRFVAQVVRIADYVRTDLPVLLAGLVVSIACRDFDRRGRWVWGAVGGVWFVVVLGLHIYSNVRPDIVETRLVGLLAFVGWLTLACLSIGLVAWWTLRAPLAFYRNRGIYWMALLALLLAGQGLVWAPARWGEISLASHLVGMVGAIVCVTTQDLPNIKRLMRSATGTAVLTIAMALLLLVGLLAGYFLFRVWDNLYVTLVGSAVLAITLALIYHPFHRSITWLIGRVLWRREYDLNQVGRDYGRAISSLLTLEQLATVAVGTVNEALGVQHGALIVISRAVDKIALRVVEGMGHLEDKQMTLPLTSPLLHLMMAGEPFFQYAVDHRPDLQGASPEAKAWLRALGAEIYLPILAGERLVGLLVLGPQGTGEPYGPEEVTFLDTLAQQTAVALQNAVLFSEMSGLYAKVSRLNEDLRQAYIKLMKMDQAKTDFLSIASHELRTPLTVIQGYTGILEELAGGQSLTPEQVLEIVQNLSTPVERLASIVTSMLDASAIEVHALDLNFTSTTLQAVITMAIGPWREALKERNLELTIEGVEDIPPLEVDVQRVSQAFSNIMSNAIKYTPDGGRVSIEASLIEDGKFLEVVVTDTGVGIDPGEQLMIFEKFYRVGDILRHSTGETKFKGAGPGLGLHIARGVVEAHGGRIWAESEGYDEERCPGSAFHVVLPLEASTPGDGSTVQVTRSD